MPPLSIQRRGGKEEAEMDGRKERRRRGMVEEGQRRGTGEKINLMSFFFSKRIITVKGGM